MVQSNNGLIFEMFIKECAGNIMIACTIMIEYNQKGNDKS